MTLCDERKRKVPLSRLFSVSLFVGSHSLACVTCVWVCEWGTCVHSEPIKSDKEVMAMCAVIAKSLEALARRFSLLRLFQPR